MGSSPPDAQTCLALSPKAMMSNWAELKPPVVFHRPDVEATCRQLEALGVCIAMQPACDPRPDLGLPPRRHRLDVPAFSLAALNLLPPASPPASGPGLG